MAIVRYLKVRLERFSFCLVGIFVCTCAQPARAQTSVPTVQALGTLSDLTQPSSGSQSVQVSSAVLTVSEDFSKLKIAPGFQLSLQTFDTADLSGNFRVDEDGNISVPLVGSVRVAGLTTSDAARILEERFLTANIMKHPQIVVAIQQYTPYVVTILGEVKNPGRVELLAPHSLLDVLSRVGGETPIAGSLVHVKHNRNGVESEVTYHYRKGTDDSMIRNVLVEPGDTVVVPRAGIVYVLGAVTRPGGYLMQEDGALNVAQALSLALGTTLQAKVGDTRIVRRTPDGKLEEIHVDYSKIVDAKEIPQKLIAEDIVYVPVSKVKTVFSTGAGLIGAAATSTVYAFRP